MSTTVTSASDRDRLLTSTGAPQPLKRTPASRVSPVGTILALQRLAGNSAVTAVLQRSAPASTKPFETDLAKPYGGPDCDPAVAGTALGLTEDIIGSRDHPTSAKISMHLFGLAVDLNYTANPLINRGSDEQAIFKRAGLLVNGSPGIYTPGMSYDQIEALDAMITKYFGYLEPGKDAELKKRI